MVWLRLTAPNEQNSVLINMNTVSSISPEIGEPNTMIYFNKGSIVYVKESLDEIEIMLRAKGEDVRRSDPRERNLVGRSFV